jgi:hypothetical protein
MVFKLANIVILMFTTSCLLGCSPASTPPPLPEPTPSWSPTSTIQVKADGNGDYSTLGEATSTSQAPIFTRILVDGQSDDWVNYAVIGNDAAGDHVAGSPDLAEVRAVNNDKYFFSTVQIRGKISHRINSG